MDSPYISEIEFQAALTSSEVKLQVSSLDDRVYLYNYKDKKDGYITEFLDEDEIDMIDQLCESFYSQKEQKNIANKIKKAVLKEYSSLKFKRVGKETFEVNDKDRRCTGYQTTITANNLINICDSIEEILEKEYKDALESADIDLDDVFEDMTDELEDDFPDIDVTFYLYHGKIACIDLEESGSHIQLLFKGADKGMQNIELTADGSGTLLELKGSVKDKTEKYRLKLYGSEMGSLEYNYKTGDISLETGRYLGNITLEGTLETDSKGISLSLDDGFIIDGMEISGTISVQKKASMKKFKGEEFDIGNASRSDFEDLSDDMYDDLYDLYRLLN